MPVRMGLFSYFKRRRERESAIPGGSPEPLTRQLKGDGKPIGQPVGQAFPQQGQSGFETLTGGPTDMAGIMAMMQQAFESGNYQVTQGEDQVIDLRGTGLREQIIGALEQHGIDPNAQGQEINAADVPGLQEQIMQALDDAGVDLGQLGDGGGITIEGGGDSGGGDSGGGDSGGDSGGGGGGD
jgi:hypothetical protein